MDGGRMFAALSATNEAILRAKTARELHQTVCDAAVHGGHIRIAAVLVPNEHKSLEVVAVTSTTGFVPAVEISVDEASAFGHGLAGRAFRSARSVWSNDVLRDASLKPWASHSVACGVGAILAVPLIVNEEPFAVYLFCFERSGSIAENVVPHFERVVENAAFALDRLQQADSRLLAEIARAEAEAREAEQKRMYIALSQTNEAIMRAQSRGELFDRVCEAAVLGGHFTSTTIALAQQNDPYMKIASTRGQNAARVLSTRFSVSIDHPEGRGLTGTSFRSGEPCIRNEFLSDQGTAHWHKLAERGGTRSGASFPLMKDGKPVGVLLFLASREGVFTPHIVELLARVAENVSFALANFDRADEKAAADERIRFLATHDVLTGLPNRVMFNNSVQEAARRASGGKTALAVLFLDLDRFKVINDSLGHGAGDQLLVETAGRLRSSIRELDFAARLGGDEFVVLVEDLKAGEQARFIAGRILEMLGQPMVLNGHECKIGCSVGIGIYPQDGRDIEEVVKKADIALYAAKAGGKNTYRFFSEELRCSSLESLVLENDLGKALENGQLKLHYQPKVNAANQITGVEALLRWHHPELGSVEPGKFIPVAEASGSIIPIGRWVLEEACRQATLWQKEGLPAISIAVNLSPKQFMDENLLCLLDQILTDTGLAPALLQLEITESVMTHNIGRAAAVMKAISSKGIRLAMDDFGTGYSSLSLMKQFPLDTIKIDRSFVRNLSESPEDRAISAAIIGLGRALHMTVVAEGVETVEQDAILKQQSCQEFQGFLFSKAVTADEIAILLAAGHGEVGYIPAPRLAPLEEMSEAE